MKRNYAWEPRSYLVRPDQFGRVAEPEWLPEPEGDRERAPYLTAQWQQEFCWMIWDEARAKHTSLKALARQSRVIQRVLWRLMRGEGPMQLEDIAALQQTTKQILIRL